ncbi:MAG: 50S ribosomal protein L23 [Candidatus Omnitrophica bacterium CG11_big_fil_rev_8_21_14_0_20_64_10]|nr:MAG: 50S ribosomal protein L23 [Candidatus Omnitrophica bacterium CG11_big_fil_rev_8_21_14_0_20_64_10]
MSRAPQDVIRTVLRTEKGTRMLNHRTYWFEVSSRSTKPEIRKAVETLFKVKVTRVRTAVLSGKPKRVRAQWGYKPDVKRAAVTLAEGNKIEVAL